MKAMLLCAGMGSRLGDLTTTLPKPLLRANGQPILGYILENLRTHGFHEVTINLHHGADQIRRALHSAPDHGLDIRFSEEPFLLGTAGAVKKVAEHFAGEECFLVHYGDIVTDQNLGALVEQHLAKNALLTLLAHHRSRSNSAISLDSSLRVTEFHERPPESFWETTPSAWVNSGVMVVSPSVLAEIPEGIHADWPKDIFPRILPSGRLFAHPLDGYRIAVDSPDRLNQLDKDISSGRFKGKSLPLHSH